MKGFLSAIFTFITFLSVSAQLKSPEQFLGYPLGSRFTTHHQIINYFKHIAESSPGMVKYEEYGQTYEGRPLAVIYISSAENISGLEEIRKNNLALAGIKNDSRSDMERSPVLIWLSYNVHGNEASSSEAAMLTAYELVSKKHPKATEWLSNSVVIMDPCINPDGRDRYVNWFNSVRGKNANPHQLAREHHEPWPGGRQNHYYFDLNRDWAWQTQVETRQRMSLYNKWLPQIHVDFHEQGINNPYYFAPAAEPFHEVITDWQREFQTSIGRNNAKYFDKEGWLYFTRERFDLFYPSYGDTYPTYKGSIGMTYEQAGHGMAGTAIITADEDTLTLYDRLLHHHTTGLSTIEITAENAAKVVSEFRKYFNQAITEPTGEFKAYLVKTDGGDRITRLTDLLDKNAIDWQYAATANLSGYNYHTEKTENFKTTKGDIVINAAQPNSNLIRVLFERQSALSDSATYDITAWSLPYAYGLVTYGFKQGLKTDASNKPVANTGDVKDNAYAYAIKWTGLNSAKVLADLLRNGLKVRYAEEPFSIGGDDFKKGTIIVTRTGNSAKDKMLHQLVKEATTGEGIAYSAIETGFADKGFDLGSDRVRLISAPRVALVSGDGVSPLGMGEVWHFFDEQLNYPVDVVWLDDLNERMLRDLDVLILPDGNYQVFSDKEMNNTLKTWVRGGGKIIAMENMVAQLSRAEWGLKMKGADNKKEKKDDDEVDYSLLRRYENRERDYLPNFNPGSIYRVELDNSHPLAYGYDDYYFTLKQDANIYDFLDGNGWNVGVIKKDDHVAGFTGSIAKSKLNDGLLFGELTMGRGSVVLLADNPLFRSFWENGKLLFSNAVFLVGR